MKAIDILQAIVWAIDKGDEPLLILAEDSPLMEAARELLKPQAPRFVSGMRGMAKELIQARNIQLTERIVNLQSELSTLRESMRAGSLLRKVGEPLPKGCYCTLGKCTAPRPEWCRDSEKRDYKPPEDSSDGL